MHTERIEKFKSIHTGTVFVLGNGESLKQYDLSQLTKFNSISMNRGYHQFVTGYYCTVLDTFYLEKVAKINYKTVFISGSYTEVPENVRWNFVANAVFIPRLCRHDSTPTNPFDLRLGWKVTHTGILALYLAQYLGFDRAVLLGYDGYGKHFIAKTRDNATEQERQKRHKIHKQQMEEFMKLPQRTIEIVNCNRENEYGHKYKPFGEVRI